jgi:PAS domain S-box-containing protein
MTNKTHTEVQLRQIDQIIKSISQPISLISSDYRYLVINDAYTGLFGAAKEKILGSTLGDFLGQEFFEAVIKPNLERCLQGETIHFQTQVDFPTMGKRWMEIDYTPYRDESGMISGVVAHSLDITKQQESEQALRESGELFKTVFEQAAVGISQVAPDGRFLHVNSKLSEIVGYSKEELHKRTFADITHPDDLALDEEHIKRVLSGEIDSYEIEKRFIHQEGHPIWIKLYSKAIRDEAGEPKYAIGSIADISTEKEAEQKLRLSEMKFRDLVENTIDWVWQVDSDFNCIYTNRNIHDITGYTTSEIIGKNLFYFMEPQEKLRLDSIISKLAQDHARIINLENTFIHKDGSPIIFETNATPVFDDQGILSGYFGTCRDITQRKQIEQKLRLHSLSLSQIEDLVVVTDLEGNIQSINDADCRMLGRVPQELIGQNVAIFGEDASTGATQQEIIRETLKEGVWRGEVTNYHADGSPLILDSRTFVIKDDEGNPIALCGISTDITERKQVEDALSESERQLDLILNSTTEMVAFYDTDLHIIWGNQASAETVGMSRDELVGLHCYQIWHQREEPCPNCPVLLARDEKEPRRSEQQTPDGRYWSIRGYPVFDDHNQVIAMIEFGLDITTSKKAELELQQHRDHLEELVAERTEKLSKMVNMMTGREVRMAELKQVIKKLRSQLKSAGIEPLANDPLLEALESLNSDI